ncbi:MAG: hypothetical protein C4294_17025, partial [Nitrospiraceae bacterium]
MLLAHADKTIVARAPEEAIAESTAHCRESGRLTWIVLDWLIEHIDQIDEHKLLENTKQMGDLSVLGLLCDAAHERNPNEKFLCILRECKPHQPTEIFFHRVAHSPLASQIAKDNALDVFRRWGYLSNELKYLRDEKRAVAKPA